MIVSLSSTLFHKKEQIKNFLLQLPTKTVKEQLTGNLLGEATMATDDFFIERLEQSRVKAELVSKYFSEWAGVMMGTAKRFNKDKRLAYFDLFCGPGRYDDGSKSVPLQILEKAINDPYLAENLITYFNDIDEKAIEGLQASINELQGINKLKNPPNIICDEIDENFQKKIERLNLIPSFSFLDPWGYKGLSIGLIEAFIKDWGCDCFFFFNFRRINMGMTNKSIASHINELFGESLANVLRERIENERLTPQQRSNLIVDGIITALEQKAGNEKRYVLPFCFKSDNGSRITHYLIFVSKHFKGYHIMKEIMHKASSTHDQGVANFAYCEADEISPRLFEMTRPLDELGGKLLTRYDGRNLTLEELYEDHSYRTRYIKRNYKDVCLDLEKKGLITVERPSSRSRKNTITGKALIKF